MHAHVARQHQRPERERARADGSQRDAVDEGVDDGAAGGEGVGGAAGGGAEDEAVGVEGCEGGWFRREGAEMVWVWG